MSRVLIFVLLTILIILIAATTVAAQSRGHFGGGGFRGGAVFNSPPVVRPGGPIVPSHPPIAVARPPFNGAPIRHFPAFGRSVGPVVVPPAFGFYSPYLWSAPIYGGFGYSSIYSAPLYPDEPYVSPQPEVPAASQNQTDLAYQVGRLSAEIEQLRQQQNTNSFVQAPVPRVQEPLPRSSPPITLVFRDGHRMEIHNYAVVGQTLWILDEGAASKIDVADLDIKATQRENHGRGLRLPSAVK